MHSKFFNILAGKGFCMFLSDYIHNICIFIVGTCGALLLYTKELPKTSSRKKLRYIQLCAEVLMCSIGLFLLYSSISFSYFIEHQRYLNILGIGFIILCAYALSRNRSSVNFALVVKGLALQFIIGFIMLRTSVGQLFLGAIASGVNKLYLFADVGSSFIFGNLANADMPWGFVFGIKVLPIIIFFGALMSLLFHWGIVQFFVKCISIIIRPILGTSGAETLCAIANSFLGQTEAPLLVKNYLISMTKSEMFVVMVSGMATISGAILAVFAAMGVPISHLLTASVMAIPASLVIAKIIMPEVDQPQTSHGAQVSFTRTTSNAIDAISVGTSDGLKLALNVGAMLIAFLALLALLNSLLIGTSGHINSLFTFIGLGWQMPLVDLNYIFSYLFAPFAYLLGFTGSEALKVGQLLGTKVTVNELIAYNEMITMGLSDRTVSIVTYALCGFSNFSCIGIQIGGIGALVPEKRKWLCELGLYTVLAGSLANLLSAMIAGILL